MSPDLYSDKKRFHIDRVEDALWNGFSFIKNWLKENKVTTVLLVVSLLIFSFSYVAFAKGAKALPTSTPGDLVTMVSGNSDKVEGEWIAWYGDWQEIMQPMKQFVSLLAGLFFGIVVWFGTLFLNIADAILSAALQFLDLLNPAKYDDVIGGFLGRFLQIGVTSIGVLAIMLYAIAAMGKGKLSEYKEIIGNAAKIIIVLFFLSPVMGGIAGVIQEGSSNMSKDITTSLTNKETSEKIGKNVNLGDRLVIMNATPVLQLASQGFKPLSGDSAINANTGLTAANNVDLQYNANNKKVLSTDDAVRIWQGAYQPIEKKAVKKAFSDLETKDPKIKASSLDYALNHIVVGDQVVDTKQSASIFNAGAYAYNQQGFNMVGYLGTAIVLTWFLAAAGFKLVYNITQIVMASIVFPVVAWVSLPTGKAFKEGMNAMLGGLASIGMQIFAIGAGTKVMANVPAIVEASGVSNNSIVRSILSALFMAAIGFSINAGNNYLQTVFGSAGAGDDLMRNVIAGGIVGKGIVSGTKAAGRASGHIARGTGNSLGRAAGNVSRFKDENGGSFGDGSKTSIKDAWNNDGFKGAINATRKKGANGVKASWNVAKAGTGYYGSKAQAAYQSAKSQGGSTPKAFASAVGRGTLETGKNVGRAMATPNSVKKDVKPQGFAQNKLAHQTAPAHVIKDAQRRVHAQGTRSMTGNVMQELGAAPKRPEEPTNPNKN